MAEVKFSIGEKVMIEAIKNPCTIIAIEWSLTGIQYKGVYWVNSERKETWFYGYELCGSGLKPIKATTPHQWLPSASDMEER